MLPAMLAAAEMKALSVHIFFAVWTSSPQILNCALLFLYYHSLTRKFHLSEAWKTESVVSNLCVASMPISSRRAARYHSLPAAPALQPPQHQYMTMIMSRGGDGSVQALQYSAARRRLLRPKGRAAVRRHRAPRSRPKHGHPGTARSAPLSEARRRRLRPPPPSSPPTSQPAVRPPTDQLSVGKPVFMPAV